MRPAWRRAPGAPARMQCVAAAPPLPARGRGARPWRWNSARRRRGVRCGEQQRQQAAELLPVIFFIFLFDL